MSKRNNILFSPSGDFVKFYKVINKKLLDKYEVYHIVNEKMDSFFVNENKFNINLIEEANELTVFDRDATSTLIREIEKKLSIPINAILNFDRHTNKVYFENQINYPYSELSKIFNNEKEKREFVLKLFYLINKKLLDIKPKFLLMSPGNIINNILITIANYYEIKNFYVFFSKTHPHKNGRRYITSSYNASLENISDEMNRLKNKNYSPSSESKKIVYDFLNMPISNDNPKKFNYKKYIKGILIEVKKIINNKKSINQYNSFSKIIDFVKILLKYNNQYKQNTKYKDITNCNFIYYPFHQIPELTLYLWAKNFSNQDYIINEVSKNIFYNKKLVVREHPHNIGRRPFGYYKQLIKKESILLGQVNRSQYDYILNAESILTIHGTTGWEAILAKKPLFTLEETFYDAINYHLRLDNISDIREKYLNHVKRINDMDKETYYSKVYLFIDAVINLTVEEDSIGADTLIEQIENNNDKDLKDYYFWS